jgi:hypothetical protein
VLRCWWSGDKWKEAKEQAAAACSLLYCGAFGFRFKCES